MNKRLLCIVSHIPFGAGLIDVGTDHGYLPVELLRRGYTGHVFASDIKEGPLQAAIRSARAAGLEERISFLLSDGLDRCPPDAVDTIVIAGMGGDTICRILDRAEWCMNRRYTLVLQPMTRAEVLRYWLVHNDVDIDNEDIVEDTGILYAVLTARYGGNTALNDAELYTGAFSMLKRHELFPAFLEQEIKRFRRLLRGLEASTDGNVNGRISIVETILKQFEEMSTHEKD